MEQVVVGFAAVAAMVGEEEQNLVLAARVLLQSVEAAFEDVAYLHQQEKKNVAVSFSETILHIHHAHHLQTSIILSNIEDAHIPCFLLTL